MLSVDTPPLSTMAAQQGQRVNSSELGPARVLPRYGNFRTIMGTPCQDSATRGNFSSRTESARLHLSSRGFPQIRIWRGALYCPTVLERTRLQERTALLLIVFAPTSPFPKTPVRFPKVLRC